MLAAGGFEPLANLVMMSLEADQFAAASESAGEKAPRSDAAETVTWVNLGRLGDDWPVHLKDVAGRTFIDTQDCPRLSDFRTADEVVQGYTEAACFDRRLASLMRVGGDWAGCLILTAHPDSANPDSADPDSTAKNAPVSPSESGAIELTYMGLVPEYRGKGLAGQLLAKTISSAKAAGASRVVLAVDRDNRPAAAIYQRLGWREVIGETVWGRKIQRDLR
jgi:ribosomal protein S18 acetylase RimI-like enzyme